MEQEKIHPHHIQGVGFQLHVLSNMIKRELDRSQGKRELDNLTGTNGWVIGYLAHHRGQDIFQRDLENAFSVRRSTMSNILALMEQKGLIIRSPVASDARLKKLELTELALHIHELVEDSRDDLEKKLTQGVTQEEIAAFLGVCEKMRRNLEEQN